MVKIRLDPLLKAEGPEPFSFAIIPLSETFFLVRRHIILDVLSMAEQPEDMDLTGVGLIIQDRCPTL